MKPPIKTYSGASPTGTKQRFDWGGFWTTSLVWSLQVLATGGFASTASHLVRFDHDGSSRFSSTLEVTRQQTHTKTPTEC